MAVPNDRSMNAELMEGATDGSVRKRHPNWGGIIEPTGDVMHDQLVQAVGAGPLRSPITYGDGMEPAALPAVLRRV